MWLLWSWPLQCPPLLHKQTSYFIYYLNWHKRGIVPFHCDAFQDCCSLQTSLVFSRRTKNFCAPRKKYISVKEAISKHVSNEYICIPCNAMYLNVRSTLVYKSLFNWFFDKAKDVNHNKALLNLFVDVALEATKTPFTSSLWFE